MLSAMSLVSLSSSSMSSFFFDNPPNFTRLIPAMTITPESPIRNGIRTEGLFLESFTGKSLFSANASIEFAVILAGRIDLEVFRAARLIGLLIFCADVLATTSTGEADIFGKIETKPPDGSVSDIEPNKRF